MKQKTWFRLLDNEDTSNTPCPYAITVHKKCAFVFYIENILRVVHHRNVQCLPNKSNIADDYPYYYELNTCSPSQDMTHANRTQKSNQFYKK
ncbi:MAG: hypothetical protein MUP82_06945 [Candidatus Marinimicrobia bacterium]|nr:hypothetical protein [Candidatus Neomarinimicrobiota bacterium]